jgi:hypothetical protein
VTTVLRRLTTRTRMLGQICLGKRLVNKVREKTRVETLDEVLLSINELRTIPAV